jgi:hypothetical protein
VSRSLREPTVEAARPLGGISLDIPNIIDLNLNQISLI